MDITFVDGCVLSLVDLHDCVSTFVYCFMKSKQETTVDDGLFVHMHSLWQTSVCCWTMTSY